MWKRVLQIATSFETLTAASQVALAQTPATVAEEESGYLVWVVFLVAGLVICATGFMNPKRSHLN